MRKGLRNQWPSTGASTLLAPLNTTKAPGVAACRDRKVWADAGASEFPLLSQLLRLSAHPQDQSVLSKVFFTLVLSWSEYISHCLLDAWLTLHQSLSVFIVWAVIITLNTSQSLLTPTLGKDLFPWVFLLCRNGEHSGRDRDFSCEFTQLFTFCEQNSESSGLECVKLLYLHFDVFEQFPGNLGIFPSNKFPLDHCWHKHQLSKDIREVTWWRNFLVN